MASVIDILLQGTLLGGLYALFAAGLSLTFGVMRLVNLAHGDIIILAAFLILAAGRSFGLSIIEGTALAIPVLFGVGFVLQVTKEAANHVPHGCPEMPIAPGNLGVSSGRMAEL